MSRLHSSADAVAGAGTFPKELRFETKGVTVPITGVLNERPQPHRVSVVFMTKGSYKGVDPGTIPVATDKVFIRRQIHGAFTSASWSTLDAATTRG